MNGQYQDLQDSRVSPNWGTQNGRQSNEDCNRSRSSKDGSQSASSKSGTRKSIEDFTFIDDKDKKSVLGQGSYGTVRLAVDKITGNKYAIKIMNKSTIFQFCTIENLKREIKIQKRMNHPNICKLYHYFEDKSNVYLVLEYAQQGSLFHNLRRAKKFPDDIAFRFFYQTCLGIDHLHKNSIIHRDLKPENLLIDQKGDIKLCDFGWSAEQRNSIVRTTFCGTVDYMPPEMISNSPHDHRVDIWCLGILLYELTHGYAPFTGNDDNAKLRNIRNQQEVVYESFISKELEDLLRSIIQRNPLHRISMAGIFAHPWMQRFYKKFHIDIQSILQQQDQNALQQRGQLNLSLNSSSTSSLSRQQQQQQPQQLTLNPQKSNSAASSMSSNAQLYKTIGGGNTSDAGSTNPGDFSFSHHGSNLSSSANYGYSQSSSSSNNVYAPRFNGGNEGLYSSLNEKDKYRYDQSGFSQSQNDRRYRLTPINAEIEEDDQADSEFFEKLKRNSQISAARDMRNKQEKNNKKPEESFIDRMLIAFGCISRDKTRPKKNMAKRGNLTASHTSLEGDIEQENYQSQQHLQNRRHQQNSSSASTSKTDFDLLSPNSSRKTQDTDSCGSNSAAKVRKTLNDFEFSDNAGVGGLLGKGSYGTVRLAIDKQTQEYVAIKIMQKAMMFKYYSLDNLKLEIQISKKIEHPNICKLFHFFEDESNVYLVLEYAPRGNLFKVLKKSKKLEEAAAFKYFYQTCLAISHLHRHRIYHRDLKPENLLIDAQNNVKVCDFGWSADGSANGRTTFCGTVDYMAPEMIRRQPHDHRIDIWSLGVLLFELTHGQTPFGGSSQQQKFSNILKNKSLAFSPNLSSELVDLISGILQSNPAHRLSMQEILEHEWMCKHYSLFGISEDNPNLTRSMSSQLDSTQDHLRSRQSSGWLPGEKSSHSNLNVRDSLLDQGIRDSRTFSNRNTDCQITSKSAMNINNFNFQKIKDKKSIKQESTEPEKEEGFFNKILIAFGCISRDKPKK